MIPPRLPASRQGYEVITWSVDSGKVRGRARFSVMPSLACADPDAVLIGADRLRLLRLPGLLTFWSHAVGSKPVGDVAAGESFVAYRLEGSLDILIAPRAAKPR